MNKLVVSGKMMSKRTATPWKMQTRFKNSKADVTNSSPLDVIKRNGFYDRVRSGDGIFRGQALIIGNGKYRTCSSLDPSTHMDAKLYEDAWKSAGLEVTKELDLTGKEIQELVKDVQSRVVNANDMFVFCYSGHGSRMNINPQHALRNGHNGERLWGGKDERDDCIVGVDGTFVSIFELTHKFNNKKFPILRNKPKIFMFDCCRGALIERSMATETTLTDIHIPLAADMVLARATMDFHVSYSPSLSKPGVYTKAFHEAMTNPIRNNGSLIDVLHDTASQMKEEGRYESSNFTSYLTANIDVLPANMVQETDFENRKMIQNQHPNSYWPAFLSARLLKRNE